ncbi:MAG: ribosomal subunit interface protein [Candidatus Sungbacteria bacterium RIFCSPHIGHO2_01_FULL_50_25]|uniref:Ribosomal subunit interface protein n=1 Tax=Candidatus Sungbacteria bacterium RIFCSPHIGHO2_01_FULL_50_25 TaxID=1802265 RepID=A0A1G2K9K6_9BACT|nr:MAG: ribosomal subunit interface protein [Candidatus Sungbacteria bacterium RIFCSPHIGHO2_01_FULL_50_25]
MRIVLKQKNLRITPALRDYIEAKLVSPVKKIIRRAEDEELPMLEIEIARTSMHHRKGLVYYAEANLSFGKRMIRVEAKDQDIYAAIDSLKDELESRMVRLRDKQTALDRRGGRRVKRTLRDEKT